MSTPPRTAQIRIEGPKMLTYCAACGQRLTKLAKQDTYCRRCGAKLDKSAAQRVLEAQKEALIEKYKRRMRGDWS